jgi:hypothetical protein
MKKVLFAVAGAATMFSLTAAGASNIGFPAMGQGTNESHVTQQSDQVGVTCAAATVRMANGVTDANLTDVKIKADDIANCSGAQVQAVAYDAAGAVLGKTTIVRLGLPVVPGFVTGWGQDLTLTYAAGIPASAVSKVRLTIADNINAF